MSDSLKRLEKLTYHFCGKSFGVSIDDRHENDHPFDARNIHPAIARVSKQLFDDGHYCQATFVGFVRVEEEVLKISSAKNKSGFPLMMAVFDEENPSIALNARSNQSEIDEQKGYRHIFAGSVSGIRNPRAHSTTFSETMDECLDHLSVASALIRKLDRAQL